MSFPQVVAVSAPSPVDQAGPWVKAEIRSLNGVVPRDLSVHHQLVDDDAVALALRP